VGIVKLTTADHHQHSSGYHFANGGDAFQQGFVFSQFIVFVDVVFNQFV